jgi:hypothetical protein
MFSVIFQQINKWNSDVNSNHTSAANLSGLLKYGFFNLFYKRIIKLMDGADGDVVPIYAI